MKASNPQDLAYEFAWRWFEYHANQRLIIFRFYLVIVGVSGAAYFTTFIQGHEIISALVGATGAFFSFCFYRLDLRMRSLIRIGEHALSIKENELAKALETDRIKITENANAAEKSVLSSFSKVFRAIYYTMILIGVTGSIYALKQAICAQHTAG